MQKWDVGGLLMWIVAVKATNPDGKVPASAGKRPQPKGGSRKGIPNKVTADLKAMILGALSDAGGQKYLQRQADENPAAFMTLVGKCMPKEITGADGKPLIPTKLKIELIG